MLLKKDSFNLMFFITNYLLKSNLEQVYIKTVIYYSGRISNNISILELSKLILDIINKTY